MVPLPTEGEVGPDVPRMSVREFRELGYLQELNRQFLHPLGLALEVVRDAEGNEFFGEVYDARADPDGFVYAEITEADSERGRRIELEGDRRRWQRRANLGFQVQPLTTTDGK